jgi:hypothetical protein
MVSSVPSGLMLAVTSAGSSDAGPQIAIWMWLSRGQMSSDPPHTGTFAGLSWVSSGMSEPLVPGSSHAVGTLFDHGISPADVAEFVGHSDASFTVRRHVGVRGTPQATATIATEAW